MIIAASGAREGDPDPSIDEIDKIEEEIVKGEGSDDSEDDESEDRVTLNGESNWHQYQGKMEQDVDTDKVHEIQQHSDYPGNSYSTGKMGDEEKGKKSLSAETNNRRYYVTKYVHEGGSDQKIYNLRERGSGTRQKTKVTKIRENVGTMKRDLNRHEYKARRYRKKDPIREMKINERKRLRDNKNYEKVQSQRRGIRNKKYKRQGGKKGHDGNSSILIKQKRRSRRRKTMQMQNKRRKIKGHRGRKTRRLTQKTIMKNSLAKRKSYPSKYQYSTRRYNRFEENKTAKRSRRNRYHEQSTDGRKRPTKQRYEGRRKGSFNRYAIRVRNRPRRYSYRKGLKGQNGKHRFKEQRNRKGSLDKYGHHIKRYKVNRKKMHGKTKGLKEKIYSQKIQKGRKRMRNQRKKHGRKRKGYLDNYCMHTKRYKKYKGRKRFKIHRKNGSRKKRKGRKSRFISTKGKTGNSRCSWRLPIRFTKQFMKLHTYNKLNLEKRLNECRKPEWYGMRFGVEKGYEAWINCLKAQRKKLSMMTGTYGHKRKHRKCKRMNRFF